MKKKKRRKPKVKLFTKSSKKAGLPPGALIHVGEARAEKVKITVFDYTQEEYHEKKVHTIDEIFDYRDTESVTWINIDGIHQVEILEQVGKHFNIHPLVLEDILHSGQRPKLESFEHYDFIVIKMLTYDDENSIFHKEQVSIILGEKFVISFQEKEGDVLEIIRERVRNSNSRIRKFGTDYLVYRILDTIVDHYFAVIEKYGEKIENLEIEVMENLTDELLSELHKLKRELVLLRKPIWPLRDVISEMQKQESKLITDSTQPFLRDVYDHVVHLIDTIENFREMASSLVDLYLSSVSNKMNEVMKTLTIMASIFIPLTFIAGIYGMNFEYIPELKLPWGYAAFWGVILIMGLIMVVYFKRKKWL